jgi:competence protein ComEA
MKKLFPDKRSAPTDTAITKDKRTLVLFLLGLAFLSIELWPLQGDYVRCRYQIALNENGDQWQVFSLPFADALGTPEMKKMPALRENSTILPLVPEQGIAGETPASLSLFINRPLPINSASKEVLQMLPGVGPHIAGAIWAEIQHQGKFASPDDLLKVSGIGPKSMQRLLPLISFE